MRVHEKGHRKYIWWWTDGYNVHGGPCLYYPNNRSSANHEAMHSILTIKSESLSLCTKNLHFPHTFKSPCMHLYLREVVPKSLWENEIKIPYEGDWSGLVAKPEAATTFSSHWPWSTQLLMSCHHESCGSQARDHSTVSYWRKKSRNQEGRKEQAVSVLYLLFGKLQGAWQGQKPPHGERKHLHPGRLCYPTPKSPSEKWHCSHLERFGEKAETSFRALSPCPAPEEPQRPPVPGQHSQGEQQFRPLPAWA